MNDNNNHNENDNKHNNCIDLVMSISAICLNEIMLLAERNMIHLLYFDEEL